MDAKKKKKKKNNKAKKAAGDEFELPPVDAKANAKSTNTQQSKKDDGSNKGGDVAGGPSIPIRAQFPDGNYPLGEIQEYADEYVNERKYNELVRLTPYQESQ